MAVEEFHPEEVRGVCRFALKTLDRYLHIGLGFAWVPEEMIAFINS
ncbi:MAG: hypothetical protein HY055_16590 [Magnetospirillum sp.]|nr:hypothetical protein [Magnetospirillum sp.]